MVYLVTHLSHKISRCSAESFAERFLALLLSPDEASLTDFTSPLSTVTVPPWAALYVSYDKNNLKSLNPLYIGIATSLVISVCQFKIRYEKRILSSNHAKQKYSYKVSYGEKLLFGSKTFQAEGKLMSTYKNENDRVARAA
jgi:hypothetical protein